MDIDSHDFVIHFSHRLTCLLIWVYFCLFNVLNATGCHFQRSWSTCRSSRSSRDTQSSAELCHWSNTEHTIVAYSCHEPWHDFNNKKIIKIKVLTKFCIDLEQGSAKCGPQHITCVRPARSLLRPAGPDFADSWFRGLFNLLITFY